MWKGVRGGYLVPVLLVEFASLFITRLTRLTRINKEQNLRYFKQKYLIANFCASFAHEAEQILCNIPHCSASHATRFAYICGKILCAFCAKIKIAQNSLRKQQNCVKFLASKNKIEQKLTSFVKTKVFEFFFIFMNYNKFKKYYWLFSIPRLLLIKKL